ncbi:MAG: hypothetical protein J2P49_10230, partial [Methylocapsa sp.]|nr:hypothetical protein [Methylocapsa sp.]
MSIKDTIFISSCALFLQPAMMAAMTNWTVARAGRTNARKALLLRVGMDLGTGGALGPIFPDGRFEYMPIPESEPARDPRQYSTLLGRQGRPRSDFLPGRL